MFRISRLCFFSLLTLAVFCACLPSKAPGSSGQGGDSVIRNDSGGGSEKGPLIALSILPQAWFVERVSGGRARGLVLAGPSQNPHNYEPSPRQVSSLGEAAAWILCGVEFEISLRPKIEALFPKLRIVNGVEGVAFRTLEEHEEGAGGHGGPVPIAPNSGGMIAHNKAASGPAIDRHTWLGSAPAKILAAHIRDTLSALDPAGAEIYAENCEALVRGIDGEFAALKAELAPLRGRRIFVYHPSFGYFLDEFGMYQEAVETGGKEPGPRDIAILVDRARAEGAAAIFVQAQFPVSAARTLAAAAGAEIISLDPLSPDWLANIRLMGEALKKAAGHTRAFSTEK